MSAASADDIIRRLGLMPHPEGGFFRENWRDGDGFQGRAHSTAIYYLLRKGEVSRWHRVDAAEIWHYYAGAPLELFLAEDLAHPRREVLGPDFAQGATPQILVPKGVWQGARSLGDFTLAGCTVAPGFEFAGFEMAPGSWRLPD
jgi:predicted cupin superfamily sugar epimerase